MQVNNGLQYGNPTPDFVGVPIGNLGYMFTGWSPQQSAGVTSTATYAAQWEQIPESTLSSSALVNAVSGDEYQIAVSAELMSEYNGTEITLEYDNTVFAVVSMNTLTSEVTFTQVSPGTIRFLINSTVSEGTINLLSFNAVKTEASVVKIYSN
jgi:hypothetical protein